MINLYGRKLTPKQAATALIEEALSTLHYWEVDTSVGQDFDHCITDRERQAIEDQLDKITNRMQRFLN